MNALARIDTYDLAGMATGRFGPEADALAAAPRLRRDHPGTLFAVIWQDCSRCHGDGYVGDGLPCPTCREREEAARVQP